MSISADATFISAEEEMAKEEERWKVFFLCRNQWRLIFDSNTKHVSFFFVFILVLFGLLPSKQISLGENWLPLSSGNVIAA